MVGHSTNINYNTTTTTTVTVFGLCLIAYFYTITPAYDLSPKKFQDCHSRSSTSRKQYQSTDNPSLTNAVCV